jgi:hypothetical protein
LHPEKSSHLAVLLKKLDSGFSDLSTLFDGIESLLFPLSWQHTLIPALPATRRTFLEAPTPYLIGILGSILQNSISAENLSAKFHPQILGKFPPKNMINLSY